LARKRNDWRLYPVEKETQRRALIFPKRPILEPHIGKASFPEDRLLFFPKTSFCLGLLAKERRGETEKEYGDSRQLAATPCNTPLHQSTEFYCNASWEEPYGDSGNELVRFGWRLSQIGPFFERASRKRGSCSTRDLHREFSVPKEPRS